jgi:hypothetical protein
MWVWLFWSVVVPAGVPIGIAFLFIVLGVTKNLTVVKLLSDGALCFFSALMAASLFWEIEGKLGPTYNAWRMACMTMMFFSIAGYCGMLFITHEDQAGPNWKTAVFSFLLAATAVTMASIARFG